jgi:ribosomal protein S4
MAALRRACRGHVLHLQQQLVAVGRCDPCERHFHGPGIAPRIGEPHVPPGAARTLRFEPERSDRLAVLGPRDPEPLRTAQVPEWLSVEPDKLAGSVTALPRRDQMPAELNEQLVVEFYSR